ncbi:MAG: response regulator [Deltaproteobacteria bacterium]|nr:response regulator [Deltaproteobacteria bacterium]
MIRLMIVDDSMLARAAIKKTLEKDPTIVVVGEAANGKEALEKIATLSPSVITCDMEMPVMDGVQTLMQVRKLHPEIKIIVLSSLTQPNSVKEQLCRNLGAAAVMAKPMEFSDLHPVSKENDLIQHIHNSYRG